MRVEMAGIVECGVLVLSVVTVVIVLANHASSILTLRSLIH